MLEGIKHIRESLPKKKTKNKNVARCSAIGFSADIERLVALRVRFHKAVSKDSDLALPIFIF